MERTGAVSKSVGRTYKKAGLTVNVVCLHGSLSRELFR